MFLKMQLNRFKGIEAPSASASKSAHFDLDIQLGSAAEGAAAHVDPKSPVPPPASSKPASKRQSKTKWRSLRRDWSVRGHVTISVHWLVGECGEKVVF